MTPMETALTAKVEYIFSPERQDEWLVLRDALRDQALRDAPTETYILNMHAAYLQLLHGAMMKALGGPAALWREPRRISKLYTVIKEAVASQECANDIEELTRTYSKAYGSSPSNGIGAMVMVFNGVVAGGNMSARSKEALTELLTAIWVSMIEDLSLANSGNSFQSSIRAPSGSGCLVLFVGLFSMITLSVCVVAHTVW